MSDEAVVKIVVQDASAGAQAFAPPSWYSQVMRGGGSRRFATDFGDDDFFNNATNPPKPTSKTTTKTKPTTVLPDLELPWDPNDTGVPGQTSAKKGAKDSALPTGSSLNDPIGRNSQIGEKQVQLANDRVKLQQTLSVVDSTYANLNAIKPVKVKLPFDPVALARERVRLEEELAQVDAEYAKLKPPKPFDPYEAARQRRTREIESARTDAAYAELFGGKDNTLDLLTQIARGTGGPIGRIFESLIKGYKGYAGLTGGRKGGNAGLPVAELAPDQTGSTNVEATSNFTSGDAGMKGFASQPGAGSWGKAKGAAKLGKGGMLGSGGGSGAAGGAGASGMGAAGGAAAAAAGPVGAALLIKEAVDEIQREIIGGIKGGIGVGSELARGYAGASTDPAVPIGKLGQAVSSFSENLQPALAVIGVSAGETAVALAGLTQAIDETAKRYEEYDAGISQAQAIAEIRHTLGDLRRAAEVSSEMSKYLTQQADLQQKFEDVKIKILNKILPSVTSIMESLEVVMPAVGETIGEALAAILVPLSQVAKALSKLVNLQEDSNREEPVDPTTSLFLPEDHQNGVQVPRI